MNTSAPGRLCGRALSAVVAAAVIACSTAGDEPHVESGGASVEGGIDSVLERHSPRLMKIAGVQGVGQALCDGSPCIRVYVADAAAQERVPESIDGIPVSTVVTGMIRAQPPDSGA